MRDAAFGARALCCDSRRAPLGPQVIGANRARERNVTRRRRFVWRSSPCAAACGRRLRVVALVLHAPCSDGRKPNVEYALVNDAPWPMQLLAAPSDTGNWCSCAHNVIMANAPSADRQGYVGVAQRFRTGASAFGAGPVNARGVKRKPPRTVAELHCVSRMTKSPPGAVAFSRASSVSSVGAASPRSYRA